MNSVPLSLQDAFNLSVSYWESHIGCTKGGSPYNFGEKGYYSFLSSAGKALGNSTKNGDYMAVLKAVDFMQNKPPEPFVIFLPGIGAHPPYGAPQDYFNMYTAEQVHEHAPLRPPMQPNKPKYHKGIISYRELDGFNQTFFDQINAIYLGRVSYVDWIFGQLLDGIEKSPMSNNTAVFVSSDHGDFAGDYHLVEKWPGGMDDILTRVPLLARIPGGKEGHIVAEPVNTFDIMATMADMAKVNISYINFARSFLKQLNGAAGNASRTVYSEGGYFYHQEFEPYDPEQEATYKDPHNLYYPRGREEVEEGCPRAVMAKTVDYKLVYRPDGVSELYDLNADKRELSNLYGNSTYATVQNNMLMDMLKWMVTTGDVTPLHEDPRGLPKPPPH